MRLSYLPIVLLLAACSSQSDSADASTEESPIPVTAANDPASCAKVTLDIQPERFADGRENFAVGTTARTKLDRNFATALGEACAEGLLDKQPLVDPRSKETNTLFIANAPDSNEASIYFAEGATFFEGPFFADGQHVQVPGPAAIKEAIFCYAVGASDEEQNRSGRCLPD